MVQMRTWLTVADNSGARQITCILPVGGDAGLTGLMFFVRLTLTSIQTGEIEEYNY